jgi:hypothetical protein
LLIAALLMLLARVSHALTNRLKLNHQYRYTGPSIRSHETLTFAKPTVFSASKTSSLSLAAKDSSNKGVYSRPSAAIERGSGFFIPGLEGPRVRLVFGIVVLVLTVLNHVLLSANLPTVAFPERVAVFYAVLLLIQAAIEFGKEEKGYVVSLETSDANQEGSAASLSQTWSTLSKYLSNDEKERVQWAAASYLSLTPATQMILLNRNDGILYRLGSTAPPADSISTGLEGTQAAFAALDKSSGGRISLPLTHPTVVALNISEVESRCVVLQKIDKESCWIMTSNQLLTAFTNDDLKWLGQLAKHVTHSSK